MIRRMLRGSVPLNGEQLQQQIFCAACNNFGREDLKFFVVVILKKYLLLLLLFYTYSKTGS